MEKGAAEPGSGNEQAGGRIDDAFKARIRQVLQRLGEATSVSASGKSWKSLTRYAAGFEPPVGVITGLAQAANVSVEWLATGAHASDRPHPMVQSISPAQLQEAGSMQHVDPKSLEAEGLVFLPQLDVQASAGEGIIPSGEAIVSFVAFSEAYLRSIGIAPRAAHLVQVKGDSMYPTLRDGEWVIVDVTIDDVHDDALYAVNYAGAVVVKRLQLMFDGSLNLSSDNKAAGYIDQRIEPKDLPDLHVVGRVKGHLRAM